MQASDVGIQEYEDQKGYIEQLRIEQEQRMDILQEKITANRNALHIHTNKEILNNITKAFTTALKGNVEGSITNVEIDSKTGTSLLPKTTMRK